MNKTDKTISKIRKLITEINKPIQSSGVVGYEMKARQEGTVNGLLMAIQIIQENN